MTATHNDYKIMNTIFLILRREYLVRVRKRSFIVMTILGPLLIFGFYAIIGWAAVSSISQKTVGVIDRSENFIDRMPSDKETKFEFLKNPGAANRLETAKADLAAEKYDALVVIPADVVEKPKTVQIYARKSVSLDLQSNIERAIGKEIETIKLGKSGITPQIIKDAKVDVDAQTISLSDGGEKSSNAIATTIIGGLLAFLIYFSVFVYGAQVMRSVLEEKTNRIVEVIISSVKPFQLMMGKIIGVALVGLTQFMLWIVLTISLFTVGATVLGQRNNTPTTMRVQGQNIPGQAQAREKLDRSDNPAKAFFDAAATLNWPMVLACFLFYFLGGYFLYSALFGAVGAAVDNETDTQQFMLPITLPIIASIAMAQFIIRDPDGTLAIWMSIIPFTSPIIMMVRIPFGVPGWQLALSMLLLVLGLLGTIWLAARIYRVGILMYGKKPTYKELAKWVFYKA
jgi:ABC-2 type transport system permease protein